MKHFQVQFGWKLIVQLCKTLVIFFFQKPKINMELKSLQIRDRIFNFYWNSLHLEFEIRRHHARHPT